MVGRIPAMARRRFFLVPDPRPEPWETGVRLVASANGVFFGDGLHSTPTYNNKRSDREKSRESQSSMGGEGQTKEAHHSLKIPDDCCFKHKHMLSRASGDHHRDQN